MPKAVQKTSVGRRIFISYCHADYPHAQRLHRALTPMCTQLGDTEIFLDSEALKAGNLWEAQIRKALETADVFIVLLSHAYNASSFCRDTELRRMFERRRQAPHIRVIGVALHSIDLKDFFVDIDGERISVSSVQCLPQAQFKTAVETRYGLRPLSDWPNDRQADAWELVKQQIENALTGPNTVPVVPVGDAVPPPVAPARAARTDLSVDWLPYLCDRGEQTDALVDPLDAWARIGFVCPLVLVTEGRTKDCLYQWAERLQRREVCAALGLPEEELSFGHIKALNWPGALALLASEDEARRRAVRALAGALGPRPAATEAEVAACHAGGARATFLVAECQDKEAPDKVALAVKGMLAALAAFPALGRNNMLVLALHLVRAPDADRVRPEDLPGFRRKVDRPERIPTLADPRFSLSALAPASGAPMPLMVLVDGVAGQNAGGRFDAQHRLAQPVEQPDRSQPHVADRQTAVLGQGEAVGDITVGGGPGDRRCDCRCFLDRGG